MSNILHRLSIDAPPERVHELASTREGIQMSWTGHPVAGDDQIGTYALNSRDDGGTTLLFSHEGWQHESEFMNGCSTNWAAYLMSLKSGAEGHGFNAYPGGEISRWD